MKKGKFNIAEKKSHCSPRFFLYYSNGKYHYLRINKKKHEPKFFYNSSL